MHKSILTGFISRYTINKIDSVAWSIAAKKLKTRFISDDKSMIGEITALDFKSNDEFDGAELGIFKTASLLKMLGVLEDDINLSLNKIGDKLVSLKLNDHRTKENFALSDLAIIPHVPAMKYIPKEFEVVLKINSDFTDTFLKAKAALPEVVTFCVESSDDTLAKVIMGQTDVNTNTITQNVDTVKNKKLENMYFNAEIFSDILSVHKDCEAEFENRLFIKNAFKEVGVTDKQNLFELFELETLFSLEAKETDKKQIKEQYLNL